MKLRVEVTAEDIKRGVRENCTRCPIARAVRRALGKRRDVAVTGGVGVWTPAGRFDLPTCALDFITAFDAGRPVKPFTFTLDIPES